METSIFPSNILFIDSNAAYWTMPYVWSANLSFVLEGTYPNVSQQAAAGRADAGQLAAMPVALPQPQQLRMGATGSAGPLS